MPVISPAEFFSNMQRFSSRQTFLVEPGLAVEPNGVDDERIAFPVTNGFTEPTGIRICRMGTSVSEDLPPHMRSSFIHDEGQTRRLHDPERIWRGGHAWHSG